MKVRRALVSVHDKSGVVEFCRGLASLGVEILSTGGTAKLLRDSGVAVREVADVTGFPEMLDGRVKTLHPKIHGGILARRDVPAHQAALEMHGIPPIDLVVVALYPFEATVARPGVTLAEAIEQIDVGGPTMIRAAAKNHGGVGVVTDPSQYAAVLDEIRATGGLGDATRSRLALEAFRRTAQYDAAISEYLLNVGGSEPPLHPDTPHRVDQSSRSAGEAGARTEAFPERVSLELTKALSLRYGENPHQSAAFYRRAGGGARGLGAMTQLHGPELGYNNILDFSAALGLLLEFDDPAAVVIKHTNPCGVAVADAVGAAMERAKASDPVSIYGGIIGVNRALDMDVVKALAGIFVEILFAPAFAGDALDELRRTKKKCRVFEVPCDRASAAGAVDYRSVIGGMLAQSVDTADVDAAGLRAVSKRAPTPAEMAALRFAWRVAKHVKSNAIVLATRDQVVGVGAGQMNRVDSARLAVARGREAGLATEGTVCASDAFFPFRDGLDVVAASGATAVIHPGGSLRDEEVIAAADEHDMAMVVTGMRHFRH
ncbi:MAG: bifunctional phosphoribosylaminoimidazolecarboxamide formyltransferase/IMP cyclohydrolase [Candidatus Rokubacteria bacterium]|nr:bifunctional phosphoribosylaminoimidazolecarboxamide formyltransferase/IMP cyclohydrolase [Candidatus Rokubacteria bacterium]